MDTNEAIPVGATVSGHYKKLQVNRWRASGIHLIISAGIAVTVLTLMLVVWYPPPLFEAAGGNDLALILVVVDVVIGPLLTLVVFKAGKRGLKLDLVVIAAFQLVALLYGCHIIFLARPGFVVFVKDRFEVVSVVELESERLAEATYPQFRNPSWTGPKLVFGAWPTDHAGQRRLLDVTFAGLDLQHFPSYYRPYAEGKAQILSRAQAISRVRETDPSAARVIDAWLSRSGLNEQGLRYLPLRARQGWVAVLIDQETARPLKMLLAQKL